MSLLTNRDIFVVMWWHWPSPEMKSRCWTPWRTESANVKLTKDLMLRLSTRDNQESYWDCRGSDGRVSGKVEERGEKREKDASTNDSVDRMWDREKNTGQHKQAGRWSIIQKNINMYVKCNLEATSASFTDNSCGSLSCVRICSDF